MNTFTLGLVVVLYFILLAYLGYLGYKNSKTSEDYLVAGRKMNPVIMALSYGATFISASAIVGFGGVAAAYGMGIIWLCFLNMLVGVVIAFIFFGKKTRKIGAKLNAQSFPHFLGAFYKNPKIRIFVAVVIFLGMPLYAAAVLKGGAVFIEQIFGINYHMALVIFTIVIAAYVVAGGMKGVMYTDALQALIMFVCMFFLVIWFYKNLGMGFTQANQALTDLAEKVPQKLAEQGHVGWTSMPSLGSPRWYILVTSLILGVGIGCLAQPQLIIRFMTVESTKQLNRGVVIGCVFIFVTVGAIYHTGALSNLFFYLREGKITTDIIEDIDKIVPYFIQKSMPEWFTAVFMLCILSASMSTLSAQFHTMGAAVGIDIFSVIKSKSQNTSNVVRLGILFSILVSYIVCYTLSAGIIARATSIFMGVCASTFLPAYFCALYWKKVTSKGAMASTWVGALASLFSIFFLHKAESASLGLCNLLFSKDCLIDSYPFFMIDPILMSLPLSCITIVIVSKLNYKPETAISY